MFYEIISRRLWKFLGRKLIIPTRVGAIPEILDTGVGILVDVNNNIDQLTEALV